ncbi:MAG: permease-like cell division protein FtsX [Myxococcaceae bacterium]|nr:permease-like cell division protein FtsX [Myxococcaceae bacterium]
MSLVAKTSYFARTALESLWRSPFIHVVAVLSLAVALTGFGAARVVASQLDRLVESLSGEVELTVYLKADSSDETRAQLVTALEQRTHGKATIVSPEQALARLEAQVPGVRALSKDNPLPWSIEVAVPPSARQAQALREVARKVEQLEAVEAVDFGEAAVDRLEGLAFALRLAGLVVFGLVFLTVVVVVAATLQLAIYARREEIEIQKLVGATNRFVRAPFLIEGALQGLLGALIALGLLLLATHVGWPRLVALLGVLDAVAPAVTLRLAGEVAALGASLGLVGSVLAVRRFLRA